MTSVSLVVRTKNESDWIGHCLHQIFAQTDVDIEVIIVDNNSTDQTISIAQKFPIKKIVQIEEYSPGRALNMGFQESTADFVGIISAHCIPKNYHWLKNLLANFSLADVAAVYGKQLPLAYSSPSDVRDLIITFGQEKRIQTKDTFFHNANSMIRKKCWESVPFDESITNIEDRLWAKVNIESGWKIVYEPEAEVFHHHGIHQTQDINRARSTLNVLKRIEDIDTDKFFPEILLPSSQNIIALIPIDQLPELVGEQDPLLVLTNQLKQARFLNDYYFVSDNPNVIDIVHEVGAKIIRGANLDERKKNKTLVDVLSWAAQFLQNNGVIPDYFLYANPDYVLRRDSLFDELIEKACFSGLNSVFCGAAEYQNMWLYNESKDNYESAKENFKSRNDKKPSYRSLPGLGTLTRPRVLSKNLLIDEKKVGIVEIDEELEKYRVSIAPQKKIIEMFLRSESHASLK